MRAVKSQNRRRATILLMVVSLLALLFVIVTGFLTLARNESQLGREISESDLIDGIVEDMDAWALSLIKEQIVDETGSVLPGGDGRTFSSEDIPGYRHSNFLAALEPIWSPASIAPPGLPPEFGLLWPGVTSLDDGITLPQPFALYQLLRDYDFSRWAPFFTDVQWNARNPFMDADGDGMPDSHFLLCAAATEAASTMAGTSVQLPRFVSNNYWEGNAFVPFALPASGSDPYGGYRGEKWQRYDEHAPYEVAMRIVSHGGMVTLDSPTLYRPGGRAYRPFNRDFTIDLFDATRNQDDGRSMRSQYSSEEQEHRLFDELHANAGAVEPALRRRGGLLPGPPLDDQGRRRVPPILAELQGEPDYFGAGFPYSLLARLRRGVGYDEWLDNWQRVNIGVAHSSRDERYYWAQAVSLSATDFNTDGLTGSIVDYDRRHSITAVNYSDELARKQDAGDPVLSQTVPLGLHYGGNPGSTFNGELKFYLGNVSKAFEIGASGLWEYNPLKGEVIIRELARRYYDMLGSHSRAGHEEEDWSSLLDPNQDAREVVSRRQQALMLAVNTVAFAAPREVSVDPTTRGRIDLVRFADPLENITYTGYSPQPFFTEILAYNPKDSVQGEDEGGEEENELAIVVELYNPQDPCYYDNGGVLEDHFALNLSQFAIRIDEAADPNGTTLEALYSVVGRQFLNGREFLAIVIKDGNDGSDRFDDVVDGTLTIPLDTTVEHQDLNLSLLRISNDGMSLAVIDRIRVAWPREDGQWKSRARDTSPVKYYNYGNWDVGTDPAGLDIEYARWNMVMGKTAVSYGTDQPDRPPPGSFDPRWRQKMLLAFPGLPPNVVDPDNPQLFGVDDITFGPTIPLITMNAAPFNDLPMFGNPNDLRPRSFPTVGFMLFIPRYSHAWAANAPGEGYHVMSRTLKRQWENRHYAWVPTSRSFNPPLHSAEYPADFGHMPVFDNTQSTVSTGYLAQASTGPGGTVQGMPWGQLVFDYFTTIDPTRAVNADNEPDVDPLRIPGRININTAPWTVLANLPLLGPYDVNNPIDPSYGQLPIRVTPSLDQVTPASPSPAFWDPVVGVLAGYGYDLTEPTPFVVPRLLATELGYVGAEDYGRSVPWQADNNGRYRLGAWLAQSAAAYRDGVQYVQFNGSDRFGVYASSHLRNGFGQYVNTGGVLENNVSGIRPPYRLEYLVGMNTPLYGPIRGRLIGDPDMTQPDQPSQFGFVTVAELLNVKGFDSSRHDELPPFAIDMDADLRTPDLTALYRGDFVKAVSLLALLDTQYLTTRSNTFTIYTSVMDRQDPEASVRSQVTVDRSNLLPRVTYAYSVWDVGRGQVMPRNEADFLDPDYADFPLAPVLLDLDGDTSRIRETPVRTTNEGAMPQVIAREHVGYFNARHDD